MTLNSGERQVAPTVAGIRRDHVARYEWAARKLETRDQIIDLACGVGYGAFIMAQAGHQVIGVDRDKEAVAYGNQHYRHERVVLRCDDVSWVAGYEPGSFAAAVCFETIEHLEDPLPMLAALRSASPVMLASVPNETEFPYRNYAFHHRHYTKDQFESLLSEAGWKVSEWWGQEGPQSEVERDVNGRTLIAVCERVSAGAEAGVKQAERVPEHVSIVGLGPSCSTFFELTRRLGGVSAYCDEVWGINVIGDVIRCDRVFHMDDVRIQEERAKLSPGGNIAAMVRWLKTHPGPIYTSVVRDGYPGLVAFPLEDVLNRTNEANGGAPYFNSTAAYAIAYAIHIGVKRISLFGLDYTMPNAHKAEKGRACCEFWLGVAGARGIQITVPEQTSLLDACESDRERLYGYDCVDVHLIDQPDGRLKVEFTARADIPTAAEIEARYDHKDHPNPLMRKSHEA